VDVGSFIVTNAEPAELIHPCERPLSGAKQNKSYLTVRLHAGEYSTEFEGESGSKGMLKGYGAAAGKVVDQLEAWINSNRSRSTKGLVDQSPRLHHGRFEQRLSFFYPWRRVLLGNPYARMPKEDRNGLERNSLSERASTTAAGRGTQRGVPVFCV